MESVDVKRLKELLTQCGSQYEFDSETIDTRIQSILNKYVGTYVTYKGVDCLIVGVGLSKDGILTYKLQPTIFEVGINLEDLYAK